MEHALVLHARVGGVPDERLVRITAELPQARRALYERRVESARRESLAGLVLALEGLGRALGRPVRGSEIDFPPGGKPRLPGGPSFSVSHSGDVVAVALSRSDDPGLDVEVERPGRDRARLERWTATEAVLKAPGLGIRAVGTVVLADDLGSETVAGTTYRIERVDLGEGIVARLASRGPFDRIEVVAVDLSAPGTVERSAGLGT